MSKAQYIVDRLLESDPDEIDPKSEFMRVDPETTHWLERNGFVSTLNDGWWHKEVNGDHYNVRWPLFGEQESRNNGWTLSMVHLRRPAVDVSKEPLFNLSSPELKNILVKVGVAEP